MATTRRKSSTTSESGAYMSQYDQEVEQRLKVIEAKLEELSKLKVIESKLEELSNQKSESSTSDTSELEKKFDVLIKALKKTPSLNIGKLSKGLL
jgi:recombinational DNA repair ATPase RecF